MPNPFSGFEKNFFRSVNALVEPAVRKGVGSPRFTPASLIVLESTGFKSGTQRRTPLWSLKLGPYRIISTARGQRSFWVKNLRKQASNSYYLGGKRRDAHALVIGHDEPAVEDTSLSPFLQRIVNLISRNAREGWAFAILIPSER